MKIIVYCQHVLGVGHFFRILEICRALSHHQVIMVTGGDDLPVALPEHVHQVRLPGLMMDERFERLSAIDAALSLETVKARRREMLGALFQREAADLFLIELFPFGRKAFRFELEPVLEGISQGRLPKCRVVCSLRDILVEKEKKSHEQQALETLQRNFDLLLVHADPAVVRLEETFGLASRITIPVIYTGFVTPFPEPGIRETLRRRLGLTDQQRLVVVSAGGGKVGVDLMHAFVAAFGTTAAQVDGLRGVLFTGPYLAKAQVQKLKRHAPQGLLIQHFSTEFLNYLAAADLSVSMAGYNTCMNMLAARVPALVLPFDQNREQAMRAQRLAVLGAVEILRPDDLTPSRLAQRMIGLLLHPPAVVRYPNLEGAVQTARELEALAGSHHRQP
jgi:predicted glycosyltransferase